MSKKFYLSILLTAIILVTPLVVTVAPKPGYLTGERRRPNEFPAWPKIQANSIKKFFREFEAFFADHFPGRNIFLMLAAELHMAELTNLDDCYRGRKNWLFLGDNYGRGVSKLRGEIFLSPHDLLRQNMRYKTMAQAAQAIGAEFVIFIGPNKSSIYPEYLPQVIIPAAKRFITPLVTSLRQTGLKIYDPTDLLKASKNKGLLYYRTDTHWNDLGAHEAFNGFLAYMGLPPLPLLKLIESPKLVKGDLVAIGGYNEFPTATGDNFELDWGESPPAWREENGRYLNVQSTSNKTVWVFGDSFANALRPYLAATFKDTRFFPHGEFEAVLESQKPGPDLIIVEIVERNFGY